MNGIQFEAVEQTVKAISEDPSLKMRDWHAKINWETGVKNTLQIRDFAPMVVDEPAPLGGTDEGANPVEMLIGAAGSCFAITFEVLSSQQGIELESVEVNVEAGLNAAVFLGLEEGDGGVLNPTINLTAKTSATKEQVEEIAKVALQKSPVLNSMKAALNLKVN
ncbi:OsmC family protein [Lentibacillus saliphilus]|uniref:OsmC family protein n=1 Tax=Lentibacillus saliphilus TaxID=2737028 RepID=UPI001C30DACC|nr:OsmC family protein [Lentibacillus saliphilus]